MKLSIITATYFRAELFSRRALSSVLEQTDLDFEWIVINDGADPETKHLVESTKAECEVVYRDMAHPKKGFGLCHGRNLGLSIATGDIIAYLDDDNVLYPTFVADTKKFWQNNPDTKFSMVRQDRRRDVLQGHHVIKQGKTFLSPGEHTSTEDLVRQKELFDSNGFTHFRLSSPQWDPQYKIFIDYEYFLQCIGQWGKEGFCLNPLVLVEYLQTSAGVIGKSSYREWATELESILEGGNYSVLAERDRLLLRGKIRQWRKQEDERKPISAFSIAEI